jgi:hypothetical protein
VVWAGTIGAVGGPAMLAPTAAAADLAGLPPLTGAFLLALFATVVAALVTTAVPRPAKLPQVGGSTKTPLRLLASPTITLMAAGRLAGDRLIIRFGPSAVFSGGASVAGLGMAAGLVMSYPAAGFAGLALLGLGLSVTVPITISAAGRMPRLPTAVAVSRVATMGYLGSFVGPAVIGVLAEGVGLTWALGLPVVLILATVPIRRLMEHTVPAPRTTGPVGGRR